MVYISTGASRQLLRRPCLLCTANADSRGLLLCGACYADLQNRRQRCIQCALPIAVHGLCGWCLRKAPSFDRTITAFDYRFPFDRLIQAGKFDGRLDALALLSGLLAQSIQLKLGAIPDVIVPVPLSSRRYRQRGFNQSAELARRVSIELGIAVDQERCHRTRHTTEQIGLSARQRRQNLKGCFSVNPVTDWQHVAIVDDVMTTGTTVGELARILKRAGVRRVDVWVVARAEGR